MRVIPAPDLPRAERVAPLPFSQLDPLRATAAEHGPVIDLTGGNPVDPVPEAVQRALIAAADSHGYPTAQLQAELQVAAANYLGRALEVVVDPDAVLPLAGTKGFLTTLPESLELGIDDYVVSPTIAYTSYLAGTHLARANAVVIGNDEPFDVLDELPRQPALIYLVSPSNPETSVLSVIRQREVVSWARANGALVVSDEAYLAFDWTGQARSILHPEVAGDDHSGLLALHSASKHSNLAGYRSGFVAGDPQVIATLGRLSGHLAALSAPISSAAIAAWNDDAHVEVQRRRYQQRGALLGQALRRAGFSLDDPQGGLYLWVELSGGDDFAAADRLAQHGILTVPGRFYRFDGEPENHVRISLTAPDSAISEAASRLRG